MEVEAEDTEAEDLGSIGIRLHVCYARNKATSSTIVPSILETTEERIEEIIIMTRRIERLGVVVFEKVT